MAMNSRESSSPPQSTVGSLHSPPRPTKGGESMKLAVRGSLARNESDRSQTTVTQGDYRKV